MRHSRIPVPTSPEKSSWPCCGDRPIGALGGRQGHRVDEDEPDLSSAFDALVSGSLGAADPDLGRQAGQWGASRRFFNRGVRNSSASRTLPSRSVLRRRFPASVRGVINGATARAKQSIEASRRGDRGVRAITHRGLARDTSAGGAVASWPVSLLSGLGILDLVGALDPSQALR